MKIKFNSWYLADILGYANLLLCLETIRNVFKQYYQHEYGSSVVEVLSQASYYPDFLLSSILI